MLSTAAIIEETRLLLTLWSLEYVVLQEMATNKEVRYTLVGPREVIPLKVNICSITGRESVIGKCVGDNIEVTVPSGKLCFQLKGIE